MRRFDTSASYRKDGAAVGSRGGGFPERSNIPASHWRERPTPPFAVQLLASHRGFRKDEVEGLLADCTVWPEKFLVGVSELVAARLMFRQVSEAIEAVVFFWDRRLAGAHLLEPLILSSLFLPPDKEKLRNRLKALFSAHIRSLLEGEAVRRCMEKMEALSSEITKIQLMLRKHNSIAVFTELEAKKKGIVAERELTGKRLGEFKAAMYCILSHLDGLMPVKSVDDEEVEIEVLMFPGEFDWCRIHFMIMRECRRLEDGLPIYAYRTDIMREIHRQQAMVLIGETGSGKSTQLVQFLADSGLAAEGSIICTQPRKIAAISLAQRVVEESIGCYEDKSIICYPSYSSTQGFNSKVIFMTDHCLLQHYMNDKKLARISYIIVDEAHERSLNTDLLLALLKGLLLQRCDLRLVIMSATADANKLSDYFFGCGAYHVVGRSFPVDIKYVPSAPRETCTIANPNHGNIASYVSDVVDMVIELHKTAEAGSILAFLTSQMEVEWACEKFQAPLAVALALHGKLSSDEQGRVFQNFPGKRKIIFATNVAETSLTIPGVKYVVDCGLVKESRFEPRTGMNVLSVCRISQSSANQRAGRAGRTEPGKCYRIYSEGDFHSMPSHQQPEIHKVHLGVAVLRILALGITSLQDFDFVDAPSPEAVDMAVKNLIQLGALTIKNGTLDITENGLLLVKLGIEPRLGKIILDSCHYHLYREGVVLAAVMANASSIFCRVGSGEDKLKSDCLKVQFCQREGDLFTLLSVYKEWEDLPQESKSKWCWDNSINAKSMRRCKETVRELEHCLKNELRIIIPNYWRWNPQEPTVIGKNLKMVILSSLAENLAMYSGYDRLGYQVALTRQHVPLHPSCSLLIYDHKPQWVVFGELLSISSQYLVCVTAIDYEWLSTLSPTLMDVSDMERRKLQVTVLRGLGSVLLRRLCGKANSSLIRLVSQVQSACMDDRIGIEVDIDKREIHLFATSEDMGKVSTLVNDVLEYEAKWLRDECIEKCLYSGGPGTSPSFALFGAGAEIKHLELDKKYLTVEVFHSDAHALDDKELLMMVEKYASDISSFHKYAGIGQEGENLEKWGRITFLTPEAAENAVAKLNEVELNGSNLMVSPFRTFGGDSRFFAFPAVKAKVFWPRRYSKGCAIIKCLRQDADFIVSDCSNMLIRGRFVHCEIGKKDTDSVIIFGLDKEISEPEIFDVLRTATNRRIFDVFLIRGDAVNKPSNAACEESLVREIAPFMPRKNPLSNSCRVQVFPPVPKDYLMKAMITFDGRLHLEAAKALDHIQGKVLTGCLPWQKIQCQQMFHSSVSFPAAVYFVVKEQLDSLFKSFKNRSGVSYSLERNENGSYRVRISANATKIVADMRRPLEEILKGKTIDHACLLPGMLQLLLSRDGIALLNSLRQETRTFILYDKHHMNVRVFGPKDKVAVAERRLVQSLVALQKNKPLEIRLRAPDLRHNLMKEVVNRFGPHLHGLKEKVPGAELTLNTRRHVLSVQGSKESKQQVEDIIYGIGRSLSGGLAEWPKGEATCPICLCEVEDCYRLESCSHSFCHSCLVEQCESAIRSRDGFPLCCVSEWCGTPILLTDLRSLLSIEKLEDLFRASLGAFVASSGGTYRFCPSPDCPAVYRKADPGMSGEPFVCGACYVETCKSCHLEYHPFMSCERYKEFKEDPDTSLKEWCKGKEYVKSCPVCGYMIEKIDGCNHIECKCGRHICWVCLEYYDSSDACYGHMRSVHQAII